MRVKVLFESDIGLLPRDYRQLMLSFLKSALSDYEGGKYYKKYFGSAEQKPFSFALLLSGARLEGDVFRLLKRGESDRYMFEMILSCGNNEAFLTLVNALTGKQGVQYPSAGGSIKLCRIDMLPRYMCKSREVFKLISPICIRDHDPESNRDIYYSFRSAGWLDVLKKNISHQYTSEFGAEADELKVRLINPKKTVVKVKGIMIEATLGEIELEGNRDLIQRLYDSGIGSKTTTFGLMG